MLACSVILWFNCGKGKVYFGSPCILVQSTKTCNQTSGHYRNALHVCWFHWWILICQLICFSFTCLNWMLLTSLFGWLLCICFFQRDSLVNICLLFLVLLSTFTCDDLISQVNWFIVWTIFKSTHPCSMRISQNVVVWWVKLEKMKTALSLSAYIFVLSGLLACGSVSQCIMKLTV